MASSEPARRLYQGVSCGALNLAFPYGWAEAIVESFEMVSVPRAPAWLLGATNISGRIVPVIDLSLLRARGESSYASAAARKQRRLLLCAFERDGVRERIALAFDGLPRQLEGERELSATSGANNLISGFVTGSAGERFAVVNTHRLLEDLAEAMVD